MEALAGLRDLELQELVETWRDLRRDGRWNPRTAWRVGIAALALSGEQRALWARLYHETGCDLLELGVVAHGPFLKAGGEALAPLVTQVFHVLDGHVAAIEALAVKASTARRAAAQRIDEHAEAEALAGAPLLPLDFTLDGRDCLRGGREAALAPHDGDVQARRTLFAAATVAWRQAGARGLGQWMDANPAAGAAWPGREAAEERQEAHERDEDTGVEPPREG